MSRKEKLQQQIELLYDIQRYLISQGYHKYNKQLVEFREDLEKQIKDYGKKAERSRQLIAKKREKDPMYARDAYTIGQHFSKLFSSVEKHLARGERERAKIYWKSMKSQMLFEGGKDYYKELFRSFRDKLQPEDIKYLEE